MAQSLATVSTGQVVSHADPLTRALEVARVLDTAALGQAAEDYLVAIALLAETGGPVTGVQLAKLLHVSEPSVTQMVRRLAEAQLVAPRSARRAPGAAGQDAVGQDTAAAAPGPAAPAAAGISLTSPGGAVASWLLLRRRVCESFFVDGVGLDWPAAQGAAHQMEHGLGADTVQQLYQALGSPTYCPHGNRIGFEDQPVPVADAAAPSVPVEAAPRAGHGGPAPDDAGIPLGRAPVGAPVVVERLAGTLEQDPISLEYLQKHGIAPGQTLVVEEVIPPGDVLSVRRGKKRCVLSAPLAAQIVVHMRAAGRQRVAAVPEDLPGPCRDTGRVRLTAVRVDGPCESGHKPGDNFVLGHVTPAGLCGATYAAVLPCVRRILAPAPAASSGPASGSPAPPFERRCPGDGYVVWRVERVGDGKSG